MKGKLTLLLILVVLFAIFVFVRFFIMDSQNVMGELRVVSSPVASVFIDNVARGKTLPAFDEKMKPGEYLLKLIPEGNATETASWNGKITVYKNALTYVNRELGSSDMTSAGEIFTTSKMDKSSKAGYGEIYIETEPQGAIITLDNDEKGVAPLILQDVLKGEHEVSVFMPGFFRRTQKINIVSGYRVNATFKLAIDQSQSVTTPAPSPSGPVTASESAKKDGSKTVIIKDTPQGWLRVREDASINASESAKIKPGEKYDLLDEKEGWYKIKYNNNADGVVSGSFTEGWISSQYSAKE